MPNCLSRGLLLALVVSVPFGCGPRQPKRATVRGRVTFNGEPVPLGDIVFIPGTDEGWDGFYAQGKIQNGEYALDAHGPVVGTNKVEIHGYRSRGETVMVPNIAGVKLDEPAEMVAGGLEPYIPPEFNTATELSIEIQSGFNEGVDFDLED